MLQSLTIIPFLIYYLTSEPSAEALAKVDFSETEDNDTKISINVPFVHQIENLYTDEQLYVGPTACGPAALTMVLQEEGMNIELADVIEKLPQTVYIKGDRFYDLPSGADIFGKHAQDVEVSPKAFYETLISGTPIILNIQNYDGFTGHAVVVTGMVGFDGEKAEALIVHDPFRGPNREFKYLNDYTLIQPEGYINSIGIQKPFTVS